MIYWTLRNNCSKKWEKRFNSINQKIEHHPIIDLKLTKNYNHVQEKIPKFDAIIITSPFSAENVIKIVKNKNIIFYTVGDRTKEILSQNKFKVLYKANNSKDLAKYINLKNEFKYLHLCSERSNKSIWPNSVETFSIYKPKPNEKFKLNSDNIKQNSIIVFGSPSGIDEWFIKKIKFNKSTIATMGETTKKQFLEYYNLPVITPINSTNDELCNSIYDYLKNENNEQ